jgi:hypothetical protein
VRDDLSLMNDEVSPMIESVEVIAQPASVSNGVGVIVMFASTVEFDSRIERHLCSITQLVSRSKNALHRMKLIVLPSVDVDVRAPSHRLAMIPRKIIKLTVSRSNATTM